MSDAIAYKLSYTEGDPSEVNPADRVGTWEKSLAFRCEWEALTTAQVIRQGKDSTERRIRLYYRGYELALTNSDRVEIDGEVYAVEYAQPRKSRLDHLMADLRRIDE
jgi:hypothetical protein